MNLNKRMKVVVGMGYVGMSLATMLACKNKVLAVDTDSEKINRINNSINPVKDEYILKYLIQKELDLTATTDGKSVYGAGNYVIVAVPTNYDTVNNKFDCSIVENIHRELYWDKEELYEHDIYVFAGKVSSQS